RGAQCAHDRRQSRHEPTPAPRGPDFLRGREGVRARPPRRSDPRPGGRSVTDGHVLEDKSHFRGVWVFLEGRAGGLRDVSTQLIGEGRRLADLRGTPLTGILPGHGGDARAKRGSWFGLDRVIVVDDPMLEIYRSRPY